MTKQKTKKDNIEKVEQVLVDETGKPEFVEIPVSTSKLVESFGYCLSVLFKTDVDDILHSVEKKIDELSSDLWFDPYRKVIQTFGYDTMCFNYSPPCILESKLEDYIFGEDAATKLPIGKCIIMGRGKDQLNNQCTKCVIALIDEDRKPVVMYDPAPQMQFVYFDNVIFFIDTFNEVAIDESVSGKN
jgi:hypothetical protein